MTSLVSVRTLARTAVVSTWLAVLTVAGRPGWLGTLSFA